ncbi:MAG: NB-ARC domain-containing protein [Microcoleaceae cyanobacterium]
MDASVYAMNFEEALAIVDTAIFERTGKHLSDAQRAVLQGTWYRRKYHEIALEYRCTPEYLKQDVGPKLWRLLSDEIGEHVSKTNLRTVIERYQGASSPKTSLLSAAPLTIHAGNTLIPGSSAKESQSIVIPVAPLAPQPRVDWGEASAAATFCGRSQELVTLKQWVLQEHCQVIALLGMGGIGKTSLSVEFADQVQNEFDCVIWRSLRNAPPLSELLEEIIQFLTNDPDTPLPAELNRQISFLVKALKTFRCLVILDNAESILQEGDRVGRYIPGCEDYGELLKRLGQTGHKSCLVITSREKPREIAASEGKYLKVRSLPMAGLEVVDCQTLIQAKGIAGSPEQWQRLIEKYAGNPLALKMVTTTIEDLFSGNLGEFLEQIQQGTAIFGDIRDLLEQQLGRLSEFEQEIMYWLAINREAVSLAELRQDILSPVSSTDLIESLESLRRRSLIEKNSGGFTQQPVVMEYIIEQLIDRIFGEIQTEQIAFLNRYAVIKSQAKDYIRESQMRVILQPLGQRLASCYRLQRELEAKFQHLLDHLRTPNRSGSSGYAGGNLINLCQELNLDLADYDFSGLTVWQAYLQDANLQSVNFARADLSRTIFAKTLGSALVVALGPENQLATGDADGKILLWSVAEGQQLLVCQGKTGQVRSVAFNFNGTLLATGSDDCTVRLWDTATGECLHRGQHHRESVNCVCFSPDGRFLASGGSDHLVCLWDVKFGKWIQGLHGHTEPVRTVAFSPDGTCLVSCGEDQTVRLWDVNSGECLGTFTGDTSLNWTVAFTSDDSSAPETQHQIIASSCDNNVIRLWDVNKGQCFQTLQGHRDSVWGIVFGPEGQLLASSSDDQTVKLWQVRTGDCLRTLSGFEGQVCSLGFDPNGRVLATGSQDQMVQLWDIETGQRLRTLRGHRHQVWSFVLSPDGKLLASGSDDQQVRLWDIATGRCIKRFHGHSEWVWAVAFNLQGHLLASGSYDQTVKLWEIQTGECLKTLHGHLDRIEGVAFSPEGRFLASVSTDQTARIWEIKTGECLRTLSGHTGWVGSVAFNPDGTLLATGSYDQTIRIWEVETGKCCQVLEGHTQRIHALAFSPDGQVLASGSYDCTVKLWSVPGGECLKTWQESADRVLGVLFTPEGYLWITGTRGCEIYCWESLGQTEQSIKILSGHSSAAWSTHISLELQILASGSHNQPIRIWNLNTQECIQILRTDKPYHGMNITGVTGITPAQKATLKILGAIDLNSRD